MISFNMFGSFLISSEHDRSLLTLFSDPCLSLPPPSWAEGIGLCCLLDSLQCWLVVVWMGGFLGSDGSCLGLGGPGAWLGTILWTGCNPTPPIIESSSNFFAHFPFLIYISPNSFSWGPSVPNRNAHNYTENKGVHTNTHLVCLKL